MKRNLLMFLAIAFITVSSLIVINDLSKLDDQPLHATVQNTSHLNH